MCAGESFRAPSCKGEDCRSCPARSADREGLGRLHLSTLFPEVRLKQFLEQARRRHGRSRRTSWRIARHLDRPALRQRGRWRPPGDLVSGGPKPGAEAALAPRQVPRDRHPQPVPPAAAVADIARELVVDLARRRACAAASTLPPARTEPASLDPLEETLDLGKTQAERWLDKYNGEWAGDLTRIFDEAEI